jgi:hypothetical protein
MPTRATTRLVLAFFLLLTACNDSPTSPGDDGPSTPATTPAKVVPPTGGVYYGFYSIGDVENGIEEFTVKSGGTTPPLVFTFHDWNGAGIEATTPVLQTFDDPLEGESASPLDLARSLRARGAVLAVAWSAVDYLATHPDYWTDGASNPVEYEEILAGVYDDHIRTCAEQIRAFGTPILLSPYGEFHSTGFTGFGAEANERIVSVDDPNGHYGSPTVPDGPERVRDVYRYVVDRFREEGVTNVTWFYYSHSAYMNPDALDPDELAWIDAAHPRHYYPGDAYVDWLGCSAYVDADTDLAYALDDALAAFAEVAPDKPIFVPEFGVLGTPGVSRAEIYRTLFEVDLPARPRVRAFTLADAPLWELAFDIPRLGTTPDELDVWGATVVDADRYIDTISIVESSGAR